MKYGIIKVKRAFLYEENGVDVVDAVYLSELSSAAMRRRAQKMVE